MSIPVRILEAKLNEARAFHPFVQDSMRMRATLLQGKLTKGFELTREETDYSYHYKRSQWRCRVRLAPERQAHALMFWVHGPKGYKGMALDALLIREEAPALHFDSHFFSRWGLRSAVTGVMLTNMMGFFRAYPDLPMRTSERFYAAQPELAAAIPEGLILGRHNELGIISCDTFKDLSLLSVEENRLWNVLGGGQA